MGRIEAKLCADPTDCPPLCVDVLEASGWPTAQFPATAGFAVHVPDERDMA